MASCCGFEKAMTCAGDTCAITSPLVCRVRAATIHVRKVASRVQAWCRQRWRCTSWARAAPSSFSSCSSWPSHPPARPSRLRSRRCTRTTCTPRTSTRTQPASRCVRNDAARCAAADGRADHEARLRVAWVALWTASVLVPRVLPLAAAAEVAVHHNAAASFVALSQLCTHFCIVAQSGREQHAALLAAVDSQHE